MKIVTVQINKSIEVVNKTVKQPSAYFATNQNSEAKQSSGDRMKSATKNVASSKIPMIIRQIVTVHFALFGNGFRRMPLRVTAMANTNWMNGTMNTATEPVSSLLP